ncbi:MAG: hypothetical protein IPM89_12160 [Candidatus Competibacteraceae bacterium]|nr:MAG: hypothetical protein IPM89_12160 [Candidatus Competibacteraceae bacterium]
MADVRKKAENFLKQVPKSDVTSNGSTAALFTKLTGSSHETLQATWKIEDVAKKKRRDAGNNNMAGLPTTTTCNAFVGQLGVAIGSPIFLGQFDIEQKLKKAGLGEAWIPAKSGKRPGYGDVFRPVRFHMGVSLDFSGDLWNTVESGQGGPGQDFTKGFDIVRRKQQPWDPASLQGWVDIEILMKLATKIPQWMIGWWCFEINATQQLVWLPERGSAQSFDSPPPNTKQPPVREGKKGEITLDADSEGATIVWSGGTIPDTLRHLPRVDYMLGNRGGAQIQAYKLK